MLFLQQFPYYILRFKRRHSARNCFHQKSFHTTQYDLNEIDEIKDGIDWASFHTTQYDLNGVVLAYFLLEKKFPYYIVRFKHSLGRRKRHRERQFPYYIVRFKHLEGVAMFSPRFWFPYYIVRFKLFTRKNYFQRRPLVSILHSTI